MSLQNLIAQWFPAAPDRAREEPRLARFYAENAGYHAMTAAGDKTGHPQVRLLQCLVRPGGRYVEVGCGSGSVSRLIGQTAAVVGIDVSPLAIEHARQADDSGTVEFICASAEKLPVPDNTADGCYSFEVLEHVWNPETVVAAMVRATRPGGFILISAPNRFSLDLHLQKRALARAMDFGLALLRRLIDKTRRQSYTNLRSDLAGCPYPDCDMITAIRPEGFARVLSGLGCEVIFWDTTYMRAHSEGSHTNLSFQRNTARSFFRHFGDHILILALKKGQNVGVT